MALVNIDNVLADTRRLLKKTDPPGGVLLMSYKRNRSIAILKKNASLFEVHENGYEQQKLELTEDKLTKELKIMIKREFPRSRKVRVVKLADAQDLNREHKRL